MADERVILRNDGERNLWALVYASAKDTILLRTNGDTVVTRAMAADQAVREMRQRGDGEPHHGDRQVPRD